jgi:nicotinate-nucleotide adenylyltransferase
MPTLCLGGSFNPIHHGHLICARTVAEAFGYDRVLLIPSGTPPHKPHLSDLAAAEHRMRMCQLVAGYGLFAVDDLEMRRDGPSYTLDTARQLKQRGMPEVHWLIGADMLNFLPKWHEPLQLLREVRFIVMARPGIQFEWSMLAPEFQVLQKHVVEAPRIDISSTMIRQRARKKMSIDFLTPAGVVEYIHQHRLYL